MYVRWTHHALTDSLADVAERTGLLLTRDDIEDIIHNPQWVQHYPDSGVSEAERLVEGWPIRVVWRDFESYHLCITVMYAEVPHI